MCYMDLCLQYSFIIIIIIIIIIHTHVYLVRSSQGEPSHFPLLRSEQHRKNVSALIVKPRSTSWMNIDKGLWDAFFHFGLTSVSLGSSSPIVQNSSCAQKAPSWCAFWHAW